MSEKFMKEYSSKNKYEKYFHKAFTQTLKSRVKGQLTPDMKRKNNTKKYKHKLNDKDRTEKNNMRFINNK